MNFDLFNNPSPRENICPGAWLLRGFALEYEARILPLIDAIISEAPPQYLTTPGGRAMSVATTSCGRAGWVSDTYGYRYTRQRKSNQAWPLMPAAFQQLAHSAASNAGFANFDPDSCLINTYVPGAKMTLHQDKNEQDFSQPIVSVSLGLPATFLFGGLARDDKARAIELIHGDVLVWGGPARLLFHGVLPIKRGRHPLVGDKRINLTFRKAL